MTALLGLLTLALALASLMAMAAAARSVFLYFVLDWEELAGEAYERSAGAAGLIAVTVLSAGVWQLGALVAAVAVACAWAARRTRA